VPPDSKSDRFHLRTSAPGSNAHDLAREVADGLRASPKRLPCRFFYDEAGSKLFEEICEQPEYYLTRAEDEILRAHAPEIVSLVPRNAQIVELGSGSGTKTRHLLAAAIARDGRAHYLPIDISRSALESAAHALLAKMPTLQIDAVEAEYSTGLSRLAFPGRGPRLYLWLGRDHTSPGVRAATWIAAVSQLIVVLVPVGLVVVGILAIVAVAILAAVALAMLLLDRR